MGDCLECRGDDILIKTEHGAGRCEESAMAAALGLKTQGYMQSWIVRLVVAVGVTAVVLLAAVAIRGLLRRKRGVVRRESDQMQIVVPSSSAFRPIELP